MSKGSASSTTTTDNTPNPWAPAQPYLKGGLSDLSSWFKSSANTQPFPGQSVAPMNADTTNALGMVASRAQSGSPLTAAAQNQLQRTTSGDFLSPESNPFLKNSFDLGANKLQAQLGSHFNSSGNLNSSMAQGESANAYNQLAAQTYGGAYNNARDNQIQASMFAPQMAQQDYADAAQMGNVGKAFEGQAGQNLTDAMQRYQFQQQNPYNRLMQYINPVRSIASGLPVTSGSQTQAMPTNGLSQGLGTAASIASLANSFGAFNQSPNITGGVPNTSWFLANPGASAAPFVQGILNGTPATMGQFGGYQSSTPLTPAQQASFNMWGGI